jgi:predicted Mrr-cat superfamily restriction endonuclease
MEQRIWKISAGKLSKFWEYFIKDKLIAFGTWDEGNLNNYSSREELKNTIIAYSLRYRHKSSNSYVELWNFFSEMKTGDIIVLYRKKAIVAIGEAKGKYEYRPNNNYDNEKYHHVKSVEWKKVFSPHFGKISERLYLKLCKPPDTFHEIKDRLCVTEIERLLSAG